MHIFSQVELDRVEEELRMEIERNAMSEPASHPVMSEADGDETDVTSNDDTLDSVRVDDFRTKGSLP